MNGERIPYPSMRTNIPLYSTFTPFRTPNINVAIHRAYKNNRCKPLLLSIFLLD